MKSLMDQTLKGSREQGWAVFQMYAFKIVFEIQNTVLYFVFKYI